MQNVLWTCVVVFLLVPGLARAEEAAGEVSASELGDYWRTDQKLGPAYSRLAVMSQLEGCFVAAYRIDEAGEVRDARIVYEDASIAKANRGGMKGSEFAKMKKAAAQSQADAILAALHALKYAPAPANAAKVAVRTRTPPIVVSMLSLETPDDPKAVAQARAAHESRRKILFDQCAAAQKNTSQASSEQPGAGLPSWLRGQAEGPHRHAGL